MMKERMIGSMFAVILVSATLLSACGTIDFPCLSDECPHVKKCGNGVLDSGETCDTAIASGEGTCPTSCTAPDACTISTLQNAGTCTAACVNAAITPCCGNNLVEDGEECDPPATGTCSAICKTCIDQMGTWISRVITTGSITAPSPIGTLTGATIDIIQKMYISHVGDNYLADFRICALIATTDSPIPFMIDYSYPPAVLGTLVTSGSAPYTCYNVGDTVDLPKFEIMTGWIGAVTSGCTCLYPGPVYPPTTDLPDECCGAIDSDGDGVYGIPLLGNLIGGAIPLWLYAGMTMDISLNNMVLTDANTIHGTTALTISGWIFGSVAGATGSLNITPDSDAVPVRAVRLDGNVDCATVLTHCSGTTCSP